jgi:hypothetical protein
MTEEGHEDQFPPRRLSACCGFGQETFAGGAGNGQDAPISAVRRGIIELPSSTPKVPFIIAPADGGALVKRTFAADFSIC